MARITIWLSGVLKLACLRSKEIRNMHLDKLPPIKTQFYNNIKEKFASTPNSLRYAKQRNRNRKNVSKKMRVLKYNITQSD